MFAFILAYSLSFQYISQCNGPGSRRSWKSFNAPGGQPLCHNNVLQVTHFQLFLKITKEGFFWGGGKCVKAVEVSMLYLTVNVQSQVMFTAACDCLCT
jgi:hypothetical protein